MSQYFRNFVFAAYIMLLMYYTNASIPIEIPCEGEYKPENCHIPNDLKTVEDYERCALGLLPETARSYFWGASGRRVTFRENYQAFKRIQIIPKMLLDVSSNSLTTTILGQNISFPVGISPAAFQKLAHSDGELATARAASSIRTVMILSSLSSTSLEEVARSVPTGTLLWMQIYIFNNRSRTTDIVRRAEKAGYRAIVVTVDAPTAGTLDCPNARPEDVANTPNVPGLIFPHIEDPSATIKDITWLNSLTKLPIVAKGILTGSDAVRAARAGADAIMVSNQGGRQLDNGPAAIDALPEIVKALKSVYPPKEVYVDGGVRNGYDVFKALGRGARVAFVGRPTIWGLTIGGEDGVKQVLSILKKEFNESMILSGNSKPGEISGENVRPLFPSACYQTPYDEY